MKTLFLKGLVGKPVCACRGLKAVLLFIVITLTVTTAIHAQNVYVIDPTTVVTPPINRNFNSMVQAGNVRTTFSINGFGAASETVFASGRIECVSPTPFTISVSNRYQPTIRIILNRGAPRVLTVAELRDAFGNFVPSNLVATGVNINTIVDPNGNINLPPGTYRVCVKALTPNGADASRPELGCGTFVVASPVTNGITMTTRFNPPANPEIIQAISRGNVQPVLFFNDRVAGALPQVKVYGRIEALSPNPFSIALRTDYTQQQAITLQPGVPVQLTPGQVLEAFGNFNEANLVTTGTSLVQLRDQNNRLVLPDGLYRICFFARYWDGQMVGDNATNPSLGCANFSICNKAGAPQFTQPVSNYTLSNAVPVVRMASPVIFTWTPPVATCGLNRSVITYDFEIREMFEGQTVTDAINNPPVFIKTALRSPTFLLDTMLNKQVLQRGSLYVTRVRAVSPQDAPLTIDNGGYSRVQAFRYGEAEVMQQGGRPVVDQARPPASSKIVTSVLKGRAVWSFKKSEEETLPVPGISFNAGAVNNSPAVITAGQSANNEAAKKAIDPNYRIVAAQTLNTGAVNQLLVNAGLNTNVAASNVTSSPVTPNAAGPQAMLLSAVIGGGYTDELRDLKIPAEPGKTTHPLAGARVFIKGVKAPGTQASPRISSDNPKPVNNVSLPVQLGMYNVASNAAPAPGNKNAAASKPVNAAAVNTVPMLSGSFLMTDESDLDEDLIASGVSDGSGNFSINFIDPKFRNITKYSRLHITVEHDDFEKYTRFINVTAPESDGDIDLGDVQLLAKTYRFAPAIPGLAKAAKIDLYCPSAIFNMRPHYEYMVDKSSGKEKKTIAGREYTKIASLVNGQGINKLFYQRGYNDNFIVQVNAQGKEQYTAYLGLVPVAYDASGAGGSGFGAGIDESKLVISVKKKYFLKNELPYISGKVDVFIEDRANPANSATIPGKGAVITVTFDKASVKEEYKETVVGPGAPVAPPGTINSLAVGTTAPANRVATTNGTTAAGVNQPAAARPATTAGQPATTTVKPAATGTKPVTIGGKPVTSSAKPVAAVNQAAGASGTGIGNTGIGAGNFRLVADLNPGIAAQLQGLYQYSTVADDDGYYRIDKLPVLAEGAVFTVKVRTTDRMDTSGRTNKTMVRGDFQEMNFQFRPEVYTVTGIAVDEAGVPLTDALLVWKSGGMPIEATKSGLFITSNYKDDSLTIKNQGYIDKTIFVRIDKSKPSKAADKKAGAVSTATVVFPDNSKGLESWASTIASQPSVVQSVQYASAKAGGTTGPVVNKPTAATFGYAVTKPGNQAMGLSAELAPLYNDLFKTTISPAGSKDLGKVGFLQKGFAKINFIVTDAVTKAKVANAVVTIDETFDTTTNAGGEVLYKGGGSAFMYAVSGGPGSDYVIQTGDVGSLPVDGTVTTIKVELEHGVRLSGRVTSKGKNVGAAEVFMDGREHVTAKTKDDGTYELFIPKGESTIKVTRSGYIGKQVSKTFTASAVENFELEDGGGRNISKLLGFEIELESHTPDGDGEKWTGSFVNLKANTLFSVSGTRKLHFTNVRVGFDGSGNPVVASREVKTDVTELPMKVYGYVPVSIKGSPQITVREETPGKGTIGGRLQLNLDQVSMAGGFIFGNIAKPLVVAANTAVDKDVPVFTADGSVPNIAGFVLSGAREDLKKIADKAVADFQAKVDKAKGDGKAALQAKLNELKAAAASAASLAAGSSPVPATLDQYMGVEVYGFQAMINLAKCKIDATGLSMAGFILSPDMPILSTMFFDIERLKLGNDFSVKDIAVRSDLTVKFSIASWSAEINSVAFSMRGFKVGGKIEVQVPQSPKNTLAFTNLAFGTSGLYGGSFSFPGAGMNIFNIINLKTGGTPLTFGEIGNTGVYKLGGSARFAFGKMFSETLEVPYFQVQTNGQFGVTVPVNKSLNAGFAKFALKSLTFNTTTPSPQIDLDGQFSVDVKMIKLSASGIHFRTSGVTVDKIGLGLDIPGTKVDGYLDVKESGFAGGGNLAVVGTPVKVKIDFHYYKTPGGVDLGASFVAGVKIPIGPVIITKVGGGFTYRSNPEFFSVTITGGASITGFEEAISLDPISITVESGPKLIGEAHLKVGPLDVAKASLVLDIPNEYFAIGVVADFQPLPDLLRAHLQGDLIISTKSNDTYFFLGAGINVDLLGLIKSEGVFALGFGVKNAQTRETISYYMSKAPSDYLSNGTFTGIYVNGVSEMGVKRENAPELDLYVISGKIWLHSRSDFSLIANFNNGNFRIAAGMSFQGGIEGCFTFICAEASAKACVNIAGGYNDSKGWNFAASASGEAVLAAGSSCGCNDICLGLFYAGGKVCVGAGAKIRFESKTGGLKELSMFIGTRSVCP